MRKFIYEENTNDLRFLNLFQFSYEEKASKICGNSFTRKKRSIYAFLILFQFSYEEKTKIWGNSFSRKIRSIYEFSFLSDFLYEEKTTIIRAILVTTKKRGNCGRSFFIGLISSRTIWMTAKADRPEWGSARKQRTTDEN